MGLRSRAVRMARSAAQAIVARTDNPAWARDERDNAGMRLLLAALLRPGDTCIDVGAHGGSFLQEIVRLAPDGHHMAFEPIADLAADLARRFPGVDVRNAAASDRTGETTFTYVPEAPGYSGIRPRSYPIAVRPETITVEMLAIDDVFPGEETLRLLKIDVEGGELLVLRGAEKTLRRCRPTIFFEHGRGAFDHYGESHLALFDLLASIGYRLLDLDGNVHDRAAFDETFNLGTHWNFVATAL